MKKNEEIILKYKAGLLNKKEEENFKEQLKNNSQLSKEYYAFEKTLASIKETGEVNEFYFNNLLVKAKNKRAEFRTKSFKQKITYAFPLLLIIFLISYFFLGKYKSNNSVLTNKFLSIENGNEKVNESITDFIIDENTFGENDNLAIAVQEEIYDITEKDLDEIMFENEVWNEDDYNEYLQYLSEKDLLEIYNNLKKQNDL